MRDDVAGRDFDPAIQAEIDKCMRCGFCMPVCPVYGSEKREAAVARGKIGIAEAILSGDLALDDPEVVDTLYDCLVCKSCIESCPSGVQFDRIILGLRAAIVRKNGLPWQKAALFGALKRPPVLNAGMKAAAALQGLVFRPDSGSPFKILPNRSFPAIASKPLRERVPETIPAARAVTRVAFFTGCSFNYFYPDTGIDIIDVLSANRVEVVIPRQQQCCGTPVLVHGDVDTSRTLARNNIDAMERSRAEYIVTGCGSCGSAWQQQFPEVLADDPAYAGKARFWAARTYDVSTFLTSVIHYRPPTGRVDAVVTYHDPCHLKKSMKVFREPRELLRNIPGVSLKEMSRPDACCGSGGSYMITHAGTATDIGNRKAADAASTGAATITTGCPACMMQLHDSSRRVGSEQKVRHYISLLADSYRGEGAADGSAV
jgi:glycolate oxidase iron-sulfur subunit